MAGAEIRTPFIRHPWCALLVGVEEDVAAACVSALFPLPCIRVASVPAALERVVSVRPLVVVLDKLSDNVAALRERANDVGGVLAVVSPASVQPLAEQLSGAVMEAEMKRFAHDARVAVVT